MGTRSGRAADRPADRVRDRGLVGRPGLALGFAANSLGAAIGLLWAAPKGPGRSWPHVALLCGSIGFGALGAIWLLLEVQALPS
ncbi:hypothetical protein [Microbacterium sp.]|uniref:hypothetical protein n=1 Tax=Microbacterium sp. TaxID=51671 RepID=UPI002812024D|nr:hypothetical protein [Microbacterium sp.]